MSDFVDDVAAFAEKFGIAYRGLPRALPREWHDFRMKFMREELNEYKLAADEIDYAIEFGPRFPAGHPAADVAAFLEKQLDALQDLVYVAIGTMLLHGFTPDTIRESWRRIQEANMAKVKAADATERASKPGMDIVKPPGWTAPTHRDLVENHAHKPTDEVLVDAKHDLEFPA